MAEKTKLPLLEAEELAKAALQKIGYSEDQTRAISHHLLDSELRVMASLV